MKSIQFHITKDDRNKETPWIQIWFPTSKLNLIGKTQKVIHVNDDEDLIEEIWINKMSRVNEVRFFLSVLTDEFLRTEFQMKKIRWRFLLI